MLGSSVSLIRFSNHQLVTTLWQIAWTKNIKKRKTRSVLPGHDFSAKLTNSKNCSFYKIIQPCNPCSLMFCQSSIPSYKEAQMCQSYTKGSWDSTGEPKPKWSQQPIRAKENITRNNENSKYRFMGKTYNGWLPRLLGNVIDPSSDLIKFWIVLVGK